MNTFSLFGFEISIWIVVPLAYLVWVTLLLAVKRVGFGVARRFAVRTATKFDDLLIEAADFPVILLIFASGGFVVERLIVLAHQTELIRSVIVAFKAVSIIATVIFVDRFLNLLLKQYAVRVEVIRASGGILRGVVRMVVIGLGVLILLDSFGISVTPLIASLGIGSLAIALALQPTLENFFSGVQLIIDKPIMVGHFIQLESGEEGYVHKIGWRSTWVRLLANNIVVLPNKRIVDSRILNYYYPETEMSTLVQVGVHYESDLDQVEKVTIEVARETLKEVTGGVVQFEPFIRYHTFADFSINFTVILRVREFVDSYLIKHEFIKRLHKRYAQEGINIPYPIRAINYDQEKQFSENTGRM